MEALLVLVGIIFLALPVVVIVLIVRQARLFRELAELRQRVDTRTAGRTPWRDQPDQTLAAAATPAPAVTERPAEPEPEPAPAPQPQPAQPAAPPRPAPAPEPKGPSIAARLTGWLAQNWFYAIAAVSLALAGIFLVQYGVETGLLTPRARVAAALVFGAALILGGERIRRRSGDTEDSATAYLPSTLSSAGLVSLMGGVLAARLLYGLIAPGPALALLFATALGGLVLGWINGPLLAAIGLAGGFAAPFLVGGQSDQPEWLLLYFALLAALGLGIDTLRRWAWVSVLALVGGFATGALLLLAEPTETMATAYAVHATLLAVLAILIPARSLTPDHAAPCLLQALEKTRPAFPTLLAAGATLASTLVLLSSATFGLTAWWTALTLAALLGAALALWSHKAPGLQDLAALPAAATLLLLLAPELNRAVLTALFATLDAQEGLTEQRLPLTVTLAMLAPLVLTLAAALRSLKGDPFKAHWAAAAALIAPLGGLALEVTWQPATLIGAWPWALHALALGGLMTALAARFARIDGTDRLRAALATLSALACLAFALTVILTDAALTLALAATVLAAAALDRRFDLAPMTGFITAGIAALGYRLLADPGLDWAVEVGFAEMFLTYGGTLAALLAARALLPEARSRAKLFLESAAWSAGGMTASLTLYHLIEGMTGHAAGQEHWITGLHATIWTLAALAQVMRMGAGGPLRLLRLALAVIFGLVALGFEVAALSLANPLFGGQTVAGPVLLNTLIPGYLLPALALAVGAARLSGPKALRIGLAVPATALTVFWAGMAIRHLWQGGDAMGIAAGITQPELYSHTVALLLVGAALFTRALQRRSDLLRRAGMAVIAVAVAKVFLLDISGLDGLARVFSFLLLGLSLAGLAWLNRWVQSRLP
ncbi:DUF2339 domain-containing protein [Sagittula sp.]|uniref:DUF2339 domain-containing protein n=1 Tax=Sagittula sp. TaxID=2038081 RepID=UPI0035156EB5